MDDAVTKHHEHVSRVLHDSRAIREATTRVAEHIDRAFGPSAYEDVAFLPCMTGAIFFAAGVLEKVHGKIQRDTWGVDVELGSCFATSYADATVASDVAEVHVKGVDV